VLGSADFDYRAPIGRPFPSISNAARQTYQGFVTPSLLNSVYNISSNVGDSGVTQALFELNNQSYSPSDLALFQSRFGIVASPVTALNGHSFDAACKRSNGQYCSEGNLDTQYITAVAQGVPTQYDYSSADGFLGWILNVASRRSPAQVYSISYVGYEGRLSKSYVNAFNTEAVKLALMGTTILAATGDDGVPGVVARGRAQYCGYYAMFPASSPYVVAVGATAVSPVSSTPCL
jgi:tripeptidyl-peptidase-1